MRYASIKAVILFAAGTLGLCLYFIACSGKKPVAPGKEELNTAGGRCVIKLE